MISYTNRSAERDENTPPRAAGQAVYLGKAGREQVILLYENWVNQTVLYPSTGEQVPYRYVFQLQGRQMASLMLGERNQYVSFAIR